MSIKRWRSRGCSLALTHNFKLSAETYRLIHSITSYYHPIVILLFPSPLTKEKMVKNIVSTLLVAILSLCNIVAGSAIVINGDSGDILDGNGIEEVVSGKLHTVENASKIVA